MDANALVGLVRARKLTVAEALHETPIDSLDVVLPMLKQYGPPTLVCSAFLEGISKATLIQFGYLRGLYYKHCAGFVPDDTQVYSPLFPQLGRPDRHVVGLRESRDTRCRARATIRGEAMRRYITIGALILWSGAACAITGNELLQYCRATLQRDSQYFDSGMCVGYIDGVSVGLQVGYILRQAEADFPEGKARPFNKYCVPRTTTREQVVSVVLEFLEVHPESLHSDAAILVGIALGQAFTCK